VGVGDGDETGVGVGDATGIGVGVADGVGVGVAVTAPLTETLPHPVRLKVKIREKQIRKINTFAELAQ